MLTIHHLGKSQSERIVWLCEELGLRYTLKTYVRDWTTILAPPELKALHPIGAAPLLEDGDVFLAESGAIMEYILARYGGGRLMPATDSPDFPNYLYWFHFANGTLQPAMGRRLILSRLDLASDNKVLRMVEARLQRAFDAIDARLTEADYFARTFSAADIIMFFSLTTMRYFTPVDLSPYSSLRRYLRRIGDRAAYRRAMAASDPGMPLLLD